MQRTTDRQCAAWHGENAAEEIRRIAAGVHTDGEPFGRAELDYMAAFAYTSATLAGSYGRVALARRVERRQLDRSAGR